MSAKLQSGSVSLTEKMVIERYSHVMHIVSNFRQGQRVSALWLPSGQLPAGTLSGAPKVRAMEIIDELEPVKRGCFGGAVGICLGRATWIRRSLFARRVKDGADYSSGAGVVADSIPQNEWEEVLNKSEAVTASL